MNCCSRKNFKYKPQIIEYFEQPCSKYITTGPWAGTQTQKINDCTDVKFEPKHYNDSLSQAKNKAQEIANSDRFYVHNLILSNKRCNVVKEEQLCNMGFFGDCKTLYYYLDEGDECK